MSKVNSQVVSVIQKVENLTKYFIGDQQDIPQDTSLMLEKLSINLNKSRHKLST